MRGVGLDLEQDRAASATPESRQIVIAGPGAGKSEVVGERCLRLLKQDVYPEEILVISFSNAAVEVVRARTAHVLDEGRGVDSATIDSVAARVREELEQGAPYFRGYDEAIERATRLLEASEVPVFDEVRHVIVDEVQDVVGVRARFVLALLERGVEDGVGFTLLGDPMQSLYDFQLDEGEQWSSPAFLEEIRARFGPNEIVLRGEYRARTAEARAVALARPALSRMTASDRLLRLRNMAADLAPFGEIDNDTADDVRAWRGTTALLCDTNARAGLVAGKLAGYEVPVELAASATDPSFAPWIAQTLTPSETSAVEYEQFLGLAAKVGVEDAEDRWRLLVRVAGSHRGLDTRDLVGVLRTGRYPMSLLRTPGSTVIASTVHRAKGLEFDNVVLVDPDEWQDRAGDGDAMARRLFVAMSRAKSRLSRARGIATRFWRKDTRTGVWLRLAPRGRGTLGLLIEPAHARALGATAQELADFVGSAVTWVEANALVTVDGDELSSWTATVDGVEVAQTGEAFGALIRRLSFDGRVPGLSGGQVEGLETVVGPAVQTEHSQHGFWTGARISGPLSFDWK
jgi:DNA helicase-2/ATP-dependent DNA helicase PcrA